MWDGIWNAGWGVHDPNVTTWKDLAGSAEAELVSGQPTWENTSYAFGGSTYFRIDSTVPAEAVLEMPYTVEVVFRGTGNSNGNGGIIGFGGATDTGNPRTFWIWERSSSYQYLIDSIQTAQGNWGVSQTWDKSSAYVFQFVVTANEASFFVNGSVYQTRFPSETTQTPTSSYLGKIGNYGICQSSLHSVRIYSRALTVEEIAHNYAVDKQRFNLP